MTEGWVLLKELVEEINKLDKEEKDLHNQEFQIEKRRMMVKVKLNELVES